MRLVPALLLTVRWSQGEIHTSPLRRRDRKLDNFFEGGSVSGSYSYNYGVQQQQIATTPPTPSPVDPTLLPTPVPFTPSTGLPTAGNGLDSPTGTSLTNGPTSASGAGTNAPTPTAGTILPTIGHSLTPPPANAFTIQPTYEYGSSKSWKGDPIYKKLKGVKIPKSKAPLPFKTLIPKGAKSSKGYPSWPPPAEVPPSLPMYPVSSKGVPPPPPPKDSSSSKGGPKGKSDSSSSKEGPPGKSSKSKDGPHESSEYESALLADYQGGVAHRLPVAAFLYVTTSIDRPRENDYAELASQTKSLFDTMYRNQYERNPAYEFMGVEIPEYGILASRLVKYDVDVYFHEDKSIPSLFEVQSVAQDALSTGGDYLTLYLNLLEDMSSAVFSTTNAVLFINNAQALVGAQEAAQQDDHRGLSIAAIVVPVVLCFAMICGVLYHQLYYSKRGHRTLIMDEGDSIEVKRESVNGDYTMADSTFRSQSRDESDSSSTSSSYEEVEVVEDSDFEEITLDGEEEVDLKQQVGEIKKSYIASNIAEINLAKGSPQGDGGLSSRSSSVASSGEPIQAYAVASQSVLNPMGHPYSAGFNKASGSVGPVPLISGSSVQVVASRPTSPPPIWTNPNLRPLKPKEEQNLDIRELAKKCEDDKSVQTIDSQSSSTPEFLKKFKQMGLSANPRSVPEPPRRLVPEDEKSILTIDSQASTTPEFLKKFKEMGLRRYKE